MRGYATKYMKRHRIGRCTSTKTVSRAATMDHHVASLYSPTPQFSIMRPFNTCSRLDVSCDMAHGLFVIFYAYVKHCVYTAKISDTNNLKARI
jgi:hypothetical protein